MDAEAKEQEGFWSSILTLIFFVEWIQVHLGQEYEIEGG